MTASATSAKLERICRVALGCSVDDASQVLLLRRAVEAGRSSRGGSDRGSQVVGVVGDIAALLGPWALYSPLVNAEKGLSAGSRSGVFATGSLLYQPVRRDFKAQCGLWRVAARPRARLAWTRPPRTVRCRSPRARRRWPRRGAPASEERGDESRPAAPRPHDRSGAAPDRTASCRQCRPRRRRRE